jgi:hypothetical protein
MTPETLSMEDRISLFYDKCTIQNLEIGAKEN